MLYRGILNINRTVRPAVFSIQIYQLVYHESHGKTKNITRKEEEIAFKKKQKATSDQKGDVGQAGR